MSHNLLLSPEPNHRWSPRHLQAMSYLYGLYTPDSDNAKVLELGCSMGANLLPFALSYPNGHATGIDIDENKITTGQQHLDSHHIKNISLYSADIATLLESELEQYDYILIRGLFAQTDLTTRTALLNWCQKHLSPTGIICIGYHTYPGSKATDSLYEALAFHAAQSDNPEEQVTGIKAMLGFMSEGLSANNPLHHQIKPALEILTDQSDEQLYLETLGGLHNPCYFIEFANSLAETGLCYVGDADAHTEIPAHWGNEAERLIQVVNPQKSKLIGQQYLDLLCGRATRMSILTHANHTQKISMEPDCGKLLDLRWAGFFQRKEINDHTITDGFTLADGQTIQVNNPISQEVFDTLGWVWPFSVDSTTLLNFTAQKDEILHPSITRDKRLKKALESIFIQLGNSIYYSLTPTPYDLNNQPKIGIPFKKELTINDRYINLYYEPIEKKEIEQRNSRHLYKHGVFIGNHEAYLQYHIKESEENGFLNHILPILINSFPEIIGKQKKKKEKKIRSKIEIKYINEVTNLLKDKKHTDFINRSLEILNKNPHLDELWHEIYSIKVNSNLTKNQEEIKKAIKINPYNIEYYATLCAGLHKNLALNKVYPLAKLIHISNPKNPFILNILGIYYKEKNHIKTAITFHEKASEIMPNLQSNLSNLASCYLTIGEEEKSIKIHENLVKNNKIDFSLYSNYLFTALHSTLYNAEQLFDIHQEYGYRVEKWAKEQAWTPSYNIESKKIRLGFSSGDLRDHAVTKFLLPYIENIDKNKFELYFYHNHKLEDHISERIKKTSDKWLNVSSLSHLDLAKTINSDSINILIDLSGHTAYNRLPVFALKPAPIQISWIGYPATTGLSTIDYYLTYNDYLELEKLQEQFTEQLLYLDIDFPFESTLALPEIASIAPARKNNYFTFASFNRTQKISNTVLKTWAEIMSHCPNDKLLIANIPDEETSQLMKDKLISYGAQEDQIIFKNRVGLEEYLQLHNEVDLLLDTFPYAGGTTTMHAMSMGLPSILLNGESMHSYQVLYIRYDLYDFIASNIDNYKAKALLWRTQLDELQNLRCNLKNKLSQSTKEMDHPVRVFERAIEYTWNNYLNGNSAKSAAIK